MIVFQVDASQQGTGDNHAISALKFKVLKEFLELNWHVLLSDVDIITLQVQYCTKVCCTTQQRCNVFVNVAKAVVLHCCSTFPQIVIVSNIALMLFFDCIAV